MMNITAETLAIADYIVLGGTILISIGIGVFYACSGGKQRTTAEYMVGNRQLKALPVAISLLVSYESSILMIGFPAEMYFYGTQFWFGNVGWSFATVLIAILLVPLFHDLQVLSAYEYLEHRFKSRAVRLLGSFLGIMVNLWYMGIVLYGPSTALQAVTGFATWNSIFVVAVAAIVYTSIGGIKAVIWADAFQFFIMIAGMLAVLILGCASVGGITEVWRLAGEGDRLKFLNFDVDPTVRHTFWGLVVGGLIRGMGLGTNQTTIQRVSTMPTLAKAKIIMIAAAPGFLIFGSMACLEGVIAYAYFYKLGCDPLTAGLIDDTNQILPYFIMQLFRSYPGLPGLFLAALFSASLSTLSSGLASMCSLLWTDFLKPVFPGISEYRATAIAKFLVVILGAGCVGIAMMVKEIGGPMTQIAGSLISSFSGPLAGMFMLGAFIPHATAKGAFAGGFFAFSICIWMAMGSNFAGIKKVTPYLPHDFVYNCPNVTLGGFDMIYNATSYMSPNVISTIAPEAREYSGLAIFYSISYLWIGVIGITVTLGVGVIVSFITGANKPGDVDPRYLVPLFDRLCFCLPECILKPLRCGVDYENIKKAESHIDDLIVKSEKGETVIVTSKSKNSKENKQDPEKVQLHSIKFMEQWNNDNAPNDGDTSAKLVTHRNHDV